MAFNNRPRQPRLPEVNQSTANDADNLTGKKKKNINCQCVDIFTKIKNDVR